MLPVAEARSRSSMQEEIMSLQSSLRETRGAWEAVTGQRGSVCVRAFGDASDSAQCPGGVCPWTGGVVCVRACVRACVPAWWRGGQ